MGILNIRSLYRSVCCVENIGDVRDTYSRSRMEKLEIVTKWKKPEWLTNHLATLRGVIEATFEKVAKSEDDVPLILNGNWNMYNLIKSLHENQNRIPVPEFIKSSYEMSLITQYERQIINSSAIQSYTLSETGKSCREEFINMRKLESLVYKLTGSASGSYLSAVLSPPSALEVSMGLKSETTDLPVVNLFGYECTRIHDILFIFDGEQVFMGYLTHFQRVCEFFLTMSSLSKVMEYLPIRVSYSTFTKSFIKSILKVSIKYPEYVGEAIKGARNLMVIKQDKKNIMDSMNALITEMGEKKYHNSMIFVEFLNDTFICSRDAVNFSHLYKAVLHPDIDMTKSFAKLSGLLSGTVINSDTEKIYTYSLRKKIYIAAKLGGFDVRLNPLYGDRHLQNQLNKPSVSLESIKSIDASRFDGSKFNKTDRFMNPELFIANPSSKSSAPNPGIGMKQIKEFNGVLDQGMFSKQQIIVDPKPVNDVETTLRGIAELNGDAAFMRFKRIVALYEKFESRFPNCTPEEISSNDIEEFFNSNPELQYLVLTEPKLGEKHKELTRMFYMGEQALKAVTIRIERIAKQLTRKQMGVSITKSYQGRKNDIEQMADSMLRAKEGTINLFISFDLSSFSMKYPHQLLRAYGLILSEITGLDELRRLDLLFKCSRVVHNTRGHKNSLGVVRGAFEGFLNFVWTSSHAVVLEIALEEANLVGAMLTYSDDGLLRLTLSSEMTKEEIQALAKKIQEVYRRHGLEFNFAKTMCSERVWEYLGEICVEGVLLPTFAKELCSFGNPLDSQDLDLLSTRFTTYISQAGALAKSGCPGQVCEFLCLYQCMSSLVRIYPDIPIEVIRALLLIPIEAGGLRVPTSLELNSISSIPAYSEFLADMSIMETRSPKIVSLISHFITVNLPDKKSAGRSIVMGEYLPSTRERLDGREVRNWLVDKLRDRLGSVVPVSPLTPERLRQLSIVLRSLDNINPRVIQRIVQATPLMENYMDFADNITKGGALRLLTVPERMVAMRKDKMNIQRRLQELRRLATLKNRFSLSDLTREIKNVYFSEYSLADPRLSTRSCSIISPSGVEPDIVVLFDLTSSFEEIRTVGELAYTEPSLSSYKPTMHNFWSEHVSKSADMKEQKRFASFCTSVLASSPTVGEAMIAIANIFGIGMPNAPPELADHVLRFRKMKGKGEDIALFGDKLLRARSAVRFSTQLMSWADTNDGVDLTTIPTLLRKEAAHYLINSGIYHKRPNDFVIKVGFSLSGFEAFKNIEMTQGREIDAYSIPEGPPISSRVRDEYLYHLRTMINEIKASRILKELNNYSREEVLELSDIAIQVWINDLSDWMSRMAIQEFHAGAAYPTLMPIVPLSDDSINLEAIKEGIYKTMRYDRKVCRLNSIEYSSASSFTRFMMSYSGYHEILMEAGINMPPVEEIYTLLPDLDELYNEWNMKRSVLKFANLPMAVIDGKDSMPMAATSVKVKAIKHMVEATQAHIFQVGQEKGWDSGEISETLGLKGVSRIDDILDVISVVNPLMRESEHRSISHPYNQTMAEIELLKFKNFTLSLWEFMKTNDLRGRVHTTNRRYYEQKMDMYGLDLLKMTYLPHDIRESFKKRLEETKKTDRQHVDHIRYLSEGMSSSAIGRAKSVVIYHLVADTKPKIIGDSTETRNLLTFFYEVILKKCIEKLRVYSPSFREIIAEEAASIGQIKVKLLEPDLEYGTFCARPRYTMTPVECKAAFGCFIQSTIHMGGYEFRTSGSLPDKLVLLLGNNMFLPDETHPSTPKLNLNSDSTPSFFCFDTDSVVDVVRITTYISSTRSGYTVAYLSGTVPKPIFTVIGYAHSAGSKMNILSRSPSPSFVYLDNLPSDDALLVRDINNWCTNIITHFGYQLVHSTRSSTPLRKQTDLSLYNQASIFQIARSTQSISDRDLGLAAALLSGVPSFADKVISYLLVRNWLAKVSTVSLVDLQEEFRAFYNKPFDDPSKKLEFRMKILNDVDETISWVKMSRLTPNFEARRQFYELHKTMQDVNFNSDIQTKPRLPGVINPYLVVSTHRPIIKNITEVSSILYITTEVPGLEDL